jgi:peptidoglycan/xylan/chitin deacetylase (PgdA/CDA1 family)
MFNGKKKAITFSYDDGVTQDIRLIDLFNKYGLKGTFNLNSELLGNQNELIREGVRIAHNKIDPKDVRAIYAGHEVAVHTLTHPRLPDIAEDAEIIRQVEEDRKKLSELVGYDVVGMAYPCGGVNNDDRCAKLIKENTGVRYARTITSSESFDPQENLFRFNPTCYHHGDWNKLFALADEFLALKTESPKIFYIWGHAYEFDIYPERWAIFEDFLKKIGGKDDIFYGTNKEVLLW